MTAPTELLHKLQIRSGSKLWLINVPQALAEELSAGAEVEIVRQEDAYDGVIAFLDTPAEAPALVPRILKEMPPDGLLWLAQKDSGTVGLEALGSAGWQSLEQITLDDEWTCVRFGRERG